MPSYYAVLKIILHDTAKPLDKQKAREEKNIPEYEFNTLIMITICSSQSIVES